MSGRCVTARRARLLAAGVGVVLLAGCATTPSVAPQAGTDAFVRSELLRANLIQSDSPSGPGRTSAPTTAVSP